MMVPAPGNGSCVWNPTTNRSLLEEFAEWLEADLQAVNEPARREKTPWVVSFAHKVGPASTPPPKACRFQVRVLCHAAHAHARGQSFFCGLLLGGSLSCARRTTRLAAVLCVAPASE